MGITTIGFLRPELNRQHRYAVGVPIEGGDIVPLKSYNTIKELEEAFIPMYQSANDMGITKPLPIEKISRDKDWDGAKCFMVRGLIKKVTKGS